MKFAENLAESLVPEWRDRYLDYKGGKKRIKRIAQSPSLAGAFTSSLQGTPGLPLPLSGSLRVSDFSFKQRKRAGSGASFALPPAALTPEIEPRNQQPGSPKNDRTPLLEPRLRAGPPADKRKSLPHPATYGDGLTPTGNDIRMENMHDTIMKEFIEWLDSELRKIEGFYKEKEEHSVTRYLLLQDQMFHLREERLRNKAKSKSESAELFKLGFSKTTKRINRLNKYELPSLPKLFKKPSKSGNPDDRRDYEHHKHQVPYYVARRQLKIACQEYYRELELLKSYRMLNRTGFRKLVKKFDKRTNSSLSIPYMEKVNASHFANSDVLDNLLTKVEDLYSANFENGNRKIAVEKLRSNLSEDHFYTTMFFSGILYGLSIPLFAYACYLALHKTLNGELPMGKYIIQIWGGFFMVLLMSILFAINCWVWAKYKVNYRFIFEFNPKTALNYREFPFLPSLFLFLLSLFGWFSFNDFWPQQLASRFWPWFFFGFAFFIIFLPFDILFLESRKWLLITAWRLIFSGFYPVEFRDFFMGDILCSLSYTMGNISFFFCMYATHWSGASTGDPVCGSSRSHLMGFFSTLPPIWRFLQCIRRYSDSGDWFPHLANMAKYTITIVYYMTLSIYRIDNTLSHRAIFITFAIVNSVYSALWDIFMDWSLMQNKSLLRDDLIYPTGFYYFAIVSDVLLRFQWIFYALFSRQIQQSAVTSFCVAIAEILRRFIWIFIRMENEHVSNTHLYRASRETPLPYETIQRIPRDDMVGTGDTMPADVENTPRYSSAGDEESTSTLRRRGTIINADVLKFLSTAIVNAHAKDFQRRKPKANDEADEISSDEDNSDAESHHS